MSAAEPQLPPEALARLHAASFTTPPPWSAESFAALLAAPGALLLCAPDGSAFALFRIIGDEAELLTIATDPARRRQGQARALLERFDPLARARGVQQVFLEVSADNHPARSLYAACGFTPSGRRPGYYRRPDGQAVDALMLCKSLAAELT